MVFFCGNPFFISETGSRYFAKCDSKFSKLFKLSELLSAIVQMLHAKQNGIFHLQWFGWPDVKGVCGFMVKVHPNTVFVALY